MFLLTIYNTISVLFAVAVSIKTIVDHSGEGHAIGFKNLWEHQLPYYYYEDVMIRDYTAVINISVHYRSPGWHDTFLNCFNDKMHLKVGFCATHDQDSDMASVVLCPYFQPDVFHVIKCGSTHYILLPENVLELNDYMCRPLNRKGRVCSECMDGYGPAVMSGGFDIQCVNCTDTWYGVPLFLFLEFFPITVFYFIILILQINITSGSITCYHWNKIEILYNGKLQEMWRIEQNFVHSLGNSTLSSTFPKVFRCTKFQFCSSVYYVQSASYYCQ